MTLSSLSTRTEPPMSKFKLIHGSDEEDKTSNLRFLADEMTVRSDNLTQKELFVFAFHYCTNGNRLKAEKLLNRIQPFYFTHEIYKDLYKALLAWQMYQTHKTDQLYKLAEHFVVVKQALPQFKNLSFRGKREFLEFYSEFYRDTTFTLT